MGDFNAHLKKWYGEIDDIWRIKFENLFCKHGLAQLVNQPTYVTRIAKTCIDLVSTDQENISQALEIHPSIHSTCHHQIVFAKFNINCPPPPPHTRNIWHYDRAKPDLMKKAALEYDWERNLGDDPDYMVDHFDHVILNIAKNFIPNEIKTFNAKEPPWISKTSKQMYQRYKRSYKKFANHGFPADKKKQIDELKDNYTKSVTGDKERYMSTLGNQLADPNTEETNEKRCLLSHISYHALR